MDNNHPSAPLSLAFPNNTASDLLSTACTPEYIVSFSVSRYDLRDKPLTETVFISLGVSFPDEIVLSNLTQFDHNTLTNLNDANM